MPFFHIPKNREDYLSSDLFAVGQNEPVGQNESPSDCDSCCCCPCPSFCRSDILNSTKPVEQKENCCCPNKKNPSNSIKALESDFCCPTEGQRVPQDCHFCCCLPCPSCCWDNSGCHKVRTMTCIGSILNCICFMNCCCGGNDADKEKCKYESIPSSDRYDPMQPPGTFDETHVYNLNAQSYCAMSEICKGYDQIHARYEDLVKDLKDSQSNRTEKITATDILMKNMELQTPRNFGETFDIKALVSINPTIVENKENLMDDAKLKKLLAYMNFTSYDIEILGNQHDEIKPGADKMCCSCCEPACGFGCGWTWGRQSLGEDYLTDTGPPPLTKSDDFQMVSIEPKCTIKHLKRGTESFIMIIAYPVSTSAPEVTIVPLDLIPPGLLGCDYDGRAINFYTWPKECRTELGEYFCCCFVCQKKTAVTARGRPFASVRNIRDPQAVVAKIQQLRGLCGKDEVRKLLTREFSIKQLGNQVEDKGVLNIYNEGYATEDFSVRVDFNNDEQVNIKAVKETKASQQIGLVHGFQNYVQEVRTREKRNWVSDDLHVYHHQSGNLTSNGLTAVPTMNVDSSVGKI